MQTEDQYILRARALPDILHHHPRTLVKRNGSWFRPLSTTVERIVFHCPCCKTTIQDQVTWVPIGTGIHMGISDVEALNAEVSVHYGWCSFCVSELYKN